MSSDAEAATEPAGAWARARRSLRVPSTLVHLLLRDPHHIPERLVIYTVDRQADAARAWAQRTREAAPDTPVAELADEQRRRTVSTARIDGAIAGTPFFIALVPAYIGFLQQLTRMHLRVAALYGHDPADPRVSADFLVLRSVHKDAEQALDELEKVRATPLPEKEGGRRPLRSWYEAVMRVLVVAGFIGPPDEDEAERKSFWAKVMDGVRLVVSGLIWALTWVVPVTFMILMSWACENDAKRFGARVLEHYAEPGEDLATAAARADRRSGGKRMVSFARGALVFLSVGLPLALVASTLLRHKGPLGLQVPHEIGALAALALVIGVTVTAVRG